MLLTRVFLLLGSRRFPLYITPTTAREWFDVWSLISQRRTQQRQWSSSSPFMDTDDIHPALQLFWAHAERSVDRARRRHLHACRSVIDNGDVKLDDGSVIPEPSGGEPILMGRDTGSPTLPPPFYTIPGTDDPRYTEQLDTFLPEIPFPKRPGAPSDASSKKEARNSRDVEEITMGVNLEDSALPDSDDEHTRLGVNQADPEHAINSLPVGSAGFRATFRRRRRKAPHP